MFNIYGGIMYTFVRAIVAVVIDLSKCSHVFNVCCGIIYTVFRAIAAMLIGLVKCSQGSTFTAVSGIHS